MIILISQNDLYLQKMLLTQILLQYYLRLNILNNQIRRIFMLDKNLQRLKFQTSVHHKQNLRSAIDPKLIDELDISPTPSTNYKNAYKSLYQDELEKSVGLHEKKKHIQKIKDIYDSGINANHSLVYQKTGCMQTQPDLLKNSNSALQVKNLNYRDAPYEDYDLFKQTKALEHIYHNYDGGQNFYKEDAKHKAMYKMEQEKMRLTLTNQLQEKQMKKYSALTEKQKEQLAMRHQQNYNRSLMEQKHMEQVNNRANYRNDMIKQIQDQRIRRGRRSLFNYNNIQRHNPITNPIEYHIDNPYILKQIQNQKMYR